MTRAEFHKILTKGFKDAVKDAMKNECVYYADWHEMKPGSAVEITLRMYLEKRHHAPQ